MHVSISLSFDKAPVTPHRGHPDDTGYRASESNTAQGQHTVTQNRVHLRRRCADQEFLSALDPDYVFEGKEEEFDSDDEADHESRAGVPLHEPECARKPFNLMDPALANPTYQVIALEPKTMLKAYFEALTGKIFHDLQLIPLTQDPTYQAVVLYPDQMFQGAQIGIYIDKSTNNPTLKRWKDYCFSNGAMREFTRDDAELLAHGVDTQHSAQSAPIYGPFPRWHDRNNPSENLNPFLLILMAHIIFHRYRVLQWSLQVTAEM